MTLTCPNCLTTVIWNSSRNPYSDPGASASYSPMVRRTHSTGADLAEFRQKLFRATPYVFVTHVLVALNVIAYVVMVLSDVHWFTPTVNALVHWGANYGPQTLDGQWWRLLTSTCIHSGIIHIAVNMWILWDIGHLVERLVGNTGFLLLYLFSGLFGSLASVWWNPHVCSVGASGAVFGMFGVLLGYLVFRRHSVPARLARDVQASGLTFLVYNMIFGLSVSGIDNAAHLGGLVAGFLGGLVASQSLDGRVLAGRVVRNLAILGSGALLLGAAIVTLPPAPLDFAREEERILNRFADVVDQWQDRKLTDGELADKIQRDVLPSWHTLLQEVDRAARAWRRNQAMDKRLVEYLQLRQQSWEALVEGLRTGDGAKFEEYDRKRQAADRFVEQSPG